MNQVFILTIALACLTDMDPRVNAARDIREAAEVEEVTISDKSGRAAGNTKVESPDGGVNISG